MTGNIGETVLPILMAKKTGEKEEERVKLCTSASVFDDDEYANVYAYNRKNAKKES